jgi:hypothetical protein
MTFQANEEMIKQKAEESCFANNWRFITCPERWLDTAELAIVTCNPGAEKVPADHPRWSQEKGSAYVVEKWKNSPAGETQLQQQIQRLVAILDLSMEKVASWHAVPFATITEAALLKDKRFISFGVDLTRWALERCKAKTIICVGKKIPATVVQNALGLKNPKKTSLKVDWGEVELNYYQHEDRRVVELPHLSRFSLLNRPKSEAAILQAVQP